MSLNYSQLINRAPVSQTTKNGVCKLFIHNKCPKGTSCPYPHTKNKIRPCNNFDRGTCHFGDNCDFSHETQKICSYYQTGNCNKVRLQQKGNSCYNKHVYKSCAYYDMGFCPLGGNCPRKHIPRKLCQDYMHGFCSKGPNCKKAHPKVFNDTDFQYTKLFFEQNKKPFTLFTCFDCKLIGHKSPLCTERKELQPNEQYDCVLCDKIHTLDFICKK